MKAQDNDKIRHQLDVGRQWRAPGQSKIQWAAAYDMGANQAPDFVALRVDPPKAQVALPIIV